MLSHNEKLFYSVVLSSLLLFVSCYFILSNNSRLDEQIEELFLKKKRDEVDDIISKRASSLGLLIQSLVKQVNYDCSVDDQSLLANFGGSNYLVSVYGVITKSGNICSNIGNIELPQLTDMVHKVSEDIWAGRIDIYGRGEGDNLIVYKGKAGSLFFIIKPKIFYSVLNAPCNGCFSLSGNFPWQKDIMSFGNKKIDNEDHNLSLTAYKDKHHTINIKSGSALHRYVKQLRSDISMLLVISFIATILIFCVYRLLRSRTLGYKINHALINNEFIPFYQPIMNSGSNRIIGLEVLVRWQRHDSTIIGPDEFMDFLEGHALIASMTEQLFGKVIEHAHSLPDDVWISLNITAKLLESGDVYSLLERFGWPLRGRLSLELTEKTPINSIEKAKENIGNLFSLGYAVKLDDFGVGYGGYLYLSALNIIHIKIDKAFVDLIGKGSEKEKIIEGIIMSAQQCGFTIIAEGVENQEQVDFLRRHEVMELQGYFYHKPMSFEDLICLRAFSNEPV